jgi:hypothetical protein
VKRAAAAAKPRIGSAAADWSRWPAGTAFRLLSTGQIYRVDDYGWRSLAATRLIYTCRINEMVRGALARKASRFCSGAIPRKVCSSVGTRITGTSSGWCLSLKAVMEKSRFAANLGSAQTSAEFA